MDTTFVGGIFQHSQNKASWLHMATPVSREKGEGIMHINTVMVDGLYIKYNLEIVNNEITIVADFVKDGEIVQKIYVLGYVSGYHESFGRAAAKVFLYLRKSPHEFGIRGFVFPQFFSSKRGRRGKGNGNSQSLYPSGGNV